MTTQTYEQLISESIRGLPPSRLAEVLDFVQFLRQRDVSAEMLREELRQLSRDEESHLEKEFANYDQLSPRE